MKEMNLGLRIASVLLAVGLVSPLLGQTATGTITGRVTDASGAIVVGASVQLTSTERGEVSSTTTNDAGLYLFPTVQPGQYSLSVQKEGFKQAEIVKLTVDVGAQLANNFKLEVGSVKEAVTVESESSLVDTLYRRSAAERARHVAVGTDATRGDAVHHRDQWRQCRRGRSRG
jgi:hypothetical protein